MRIIAKIEIALICNIINLTKMRIIGIIRTLRLNIYP